ncbi:MAG: hypothetical protein ACRBI6_04475, partial [Acidimicrobiales bacterium]
RVEDSDGNLSAFATDFSANDDGALLIGYYQRANTPGADGAAFNSNMYSVNGLASMVADSTRKDYMYGLARASNPELESPIYAAGGAPRAYSENLITFAIDTTDEGRFNGERDVSHLLTSRSVRINHIRAVQANREFSPVTTKRGWGEQSFTAGGKKLPILVDRDMAMGSIYGLDMSSFRKYKQADIEPVDSHEMRFVDQKDAHNTHIVESCNHACAAAPANFVIDDLTYSETALLP